ncbi:MAG: PrsW family intramembrane metalloprotease [Deltaproteobacteria bacterium]|nr:PrsW family intramembrane metalloprotease [Deltaproteobacteria bacterium]
MKKVPDQDSVFNEPHMTGKPFVPDPSEKIELVENRDDCELSEQSVWEEPNFNGELAVMPQGAKTYESWFKAGIASTSYRKSILITVMVALSAGPWAIIGAFAGFSSYSAFQFINLVLFGPLMEEVLKTGALFWVVEKRPFFFKSKYQIIFAAMMGGLIFGVIENVVYLKIYIDQPTESIIRLRWIVCTSLHTGCSIIAGLGIGRMWKSAMGDYHKPDFSLWFPYLFTAVSVHGVYNGSVLLLELGKKYLF